MCIGMQKQFSVDFISGSKKIEIGIKQALFIAI